MYLLYGDIGNLYRRMDQPDKAIEAYKKILEKEPANQSARLELGKALLEKQDVAEAKKVLEQVNVNSITNPSALLEMGRYFANAKDMAEAVKYWEKAISIDPKMVDVYMELAPAYVSMGQNDKAKQALQKAIELAPNTDTAKMAQEMLDSMQ
jgi:FimV-like protein